MTAVVPILIYHSIAGNAAPQFRRWVVSPRRFADQLACLRDEGYQSLTVTQLTRVMDGAGALPAKPVVLTFDDGFADFHANALPLLQRHGFTATLYIITGYVGSASRWLYREGEAGRPMLNWSQIAEIDASGIECGAHTRRHPQLDTLRRAAARDEICLSKDDLEQRLGKAVLSFAYPHGYNSATIRRQVQEAGYTSACAAKHALSSLDDDRFALARLIIGGDDDQRRFHQLLTGQGVLIAPIPESVLTKGWRFVRRAASVMYSP